MAGEPCHAAANVACTNACRKVDELVHAADAKAAGVTVIRRFSGGGTVAVDADTVFATLISDEKALPKVRIIKRILEIYDLEPGGILFVSIGA